MVPETDWCNFADHEKVLLMSATSVKTSIFEQSHAWEFSEGINNYSSESELLLQVWYCNVPQRRTRAIEGEVNIQIVFLMEPLYKLSFVTLLAGKLKPLLCSVITTIHGAFFSKLDPTLHTAAW